MEKHDFKPSPYPKNMEFRWEAKQSVAKKHKNTVFMWQKSGFDALECQFEKKGQAQKSIYNLAATSSYYKNQNKC